MDYDTKLEIIFAIAFAVVFVIGCTVLGLGVDMEYCTLQGLGVGMVIIGGVGDAAIALKHA